MNIIIKFINLERTEAIESYAHKKIKEVLEKFTNDSNKDNIIAQIEITKTNNHHLRGDMYRASAEIKGFHKKYYVESIKDDLYFSIDDLKDKLDEIVSDTKNKKSSIARKLAVKFKKLFKKGE